MWVRIIKANRTEEEERKKEILLEMEDGRQRDKEMEEKKKSVGEDE
jgi:hypothetical protein